MAVSVAPLPSDGIDWGITRLEALEACRIGARPRGTGP